MNLIIGSASALLLAATSYAHAQVAFRQADIDIEVHADGTSVQTSHIAIEAPNDSVAQRIAQQPIVYSSSREELTVLDAHTRKLSGSTLPVGAEAIRTEPAPGSSNFPLFNDLNCKVIIFPSVTAYDVIAYTTRREIRQPLFSGQFLWHAWLNRTVRWPDYRVTVTSPAAFPLAVEQHGMDVERQQDGDHVIYRIRAAYPVALASDPSAIGPFGRAPWLTISSLANYGGMATLYAKLSGPKEHITPEIEQLAEKLTAGIADR